MKHFIAVISFSGLALFSASANALQLRGCNCDCRPTMISSTVLDELSQPDGTAKDAETGDVRWERAQAVAERDREYSAAEHRYDDHDYRVASYLIDAQYDIASAEIEQVELNKVGTAGKDLDVARSEIDKALKVAKAKQRPPLDFLWDKLQKVALATTLCHGQSRGEDSYQYLSLKASLQHSIGVL